MSAAEVGAVETSAELATGDQRLKTGPKSGIWQLWVDTGGTFTDCVAVDPEGVLRRAKVLSSSALRGRIAQVVDAGTLRLEGRWQVGDDFFRGCRLRLFEQVGEGQLVEGYEAATATLRLAEPLDSAPAPGAGFEVQFEEEAPLLGARLVTGTAPAEPLPRLAVRLATTRGTNALLERRGARVALFITRGFGDLLLIGTQQRPELFALRVEKPPPLYAAVVEVTERLAADGSVLEPLDLMAFDAELAPLREDGIDVAAVALLHSYSNPDHERQLAERLRSRGFRHVSCSAELAPLIQILPRAETAAVDAYLSPVIGDYLARVGAALREGGLHVLTSAGGLVRAEDYRAKDSLLSGPAGGVVGAALAGTRAGFPRVISFDMGGTSTDVARFDGDFEYLFEHRVGDVRLVAPALAIESVAAGGGSICRFDGTQLKVGPESAGALPGPACYGVGGPLTLTDVNLSMGRLDPARFGIPVEIEAAEAAFVEVMRQVARAGGKPDREALLEGFLRIANERMADAIRAISIRRGYDPAEYALVSFGGAGGQHACAVADLLGMKTIVVPPDAGLLSALGLGAAVVERFVHRQVLEPLEAVQGRLEGMLAEMSEAAVAAVAAEGVPAAEAEIRRRLLNLRFQGQDSVVTLDQPENESVGDAFLRVYESLYGYRPEMRAVEVESVRVVASSRGRQEEPPPPPKAFFEARAGDRRRAVFAATWAEVAVFVRQDLLPGATLAGPALVFEEHSATVIEVGWRAWVDGGGALVLERP